MKNKRAPETLENRVEKLESMVGILREAVDLLKSSCACSVSERMSGHLVDCAVPHVNELMNEFVETAKS